MPQRFGAGAADAGVAGLALVDIGFALGLDPRQLEFVAQDGGQFFQRDFDFQHVRAGFAAGLADAVFVFALSDRGAFFAGPLAYAARAVLAVAEVGHVELRQGNADQIVALAADHFAVRDVLPQVLADLAPHDLLESRLIALDLDVHLNPLRSFFTSHVTLPHSVRITLRTSLFPELFAV